MKANKVWLGICDAAGYTVVVISKTQKDAELALYRKWLDWIGTDFAVQNKVITFQMLSDFNGARVRPIDLESAAIWEQL